MGICQSDQKKHERKQLTHAAPPQPKPQPAQVPQPAPQPQAPLKTPGEQAQPKTPRETPREGKYTRRRDDMRPPPLAKERSRRKLKGSHPTVLAYYAGSWYVAEVTKDNGDRFDVVWDDDTYTKDLPKDQTYTLEVGSPIEARWGGEWYSCKVLQLHPTFDVKWRDATMSQNIPTTALRPPTSPLGDSSKQVDPLTPVKTGVFGRRSVLVPGCDVEIKGPDGIWRPGVVHKVGDACTVEYASGEKAAVPLSDVRTPLENLNYDLN
eukprot:TRINITY_DN2858_c0_g1_i1.p1 TRINITY_DN2858_c0_g1~~TRINITY_DN2858_c0_g1_i1.p1  ORF type:complete len:278 (+),score=68.63 TRINITY_DN2858_c0_g1_i1:42-836(+)